MRPCLVGEEKHFATLFVCDNYCLIMDYLGSKDLSCKFRPNYAISFYF